MPKQYINDDGVEETIYTEEEIKAMQEEHAKALEDKDNHIKEKLDQFQKAKGNVETEKDEIVQKALLESQQAKQLAEEATKAIADANQAKIDTAKEFYFKSIVGDSTELREKLETAYNMINIETTDENSVYERVQNAVRMSGLTVSTFNPVSMPMGGGYQVPSADANAKGNYESFKNDLGINMETL